jgi:alkylation response protein AidB-like acyl-CoA dehydrogenase
MRVSTQSQGGCSFFLAAPERAFAPEDFMHDERLMAATAEQFCRKEVLGHLDRIEALEEGFTPAVVRRAGELGFCGVDAPEAYGGLGLGRNLAARILEFLSLNASFGVTIGITSGISQTGLALFGSDALRRRYLPSLTSGEQIGAYALSEPNAGSDALGLSTRAVRQLDHWVLNGTKMWISNARWAHQFLVIARTGDGFSAFVVERDRPGLTVEREERKAGLLGSSTARVTFDNVEVPLANLLYEEGKGHHVAFNALNLGRFKLASMSVGPARLAIQEAANYSQERRQFGRPIGEFGLVRRKLAEMAARFYAAESAIYRTGAYIDEAFALSDGSWAGNAAACGANAVECSLIKVLATEAEAFIVDEALQVFGGYGYTVEFPVARLWRDARVSRIYEGTNEVNRLFAADRLAKRLAVSGSGFSGPGDSFIGELAGRALTQAVERYGTESLARSAPQTLTGAVADLAMLAYAEQSARLRAQRFGGLHGDLCRLFAAWAQAQAAAACQVATGEAVQLPPSSYDAVDPIAQAVIDKRGVPV